MSSQKVGSGLASLGAMIFFYYSAWIFIVVTYKQPFIDQGHWANDFFLDLVWAVRIPQILLSVFASVLVLGGLALLLQGKQKVS